ncbi:protein FAM227A-like [Dendronephthya gigantea]|uniref:protein FAM227A-like n=1 Tax=Dendronephthya gigantea TaxID=151771 RepID=UPI00106A62BA|nr:protein FAM227A-like [Dendronephthya gigantea]
MSHSFNLNGLVDDFDERSQSLSSPAGRVDSIDAISKKISSLDTELTSFCPESELVIDSYADVQTSSSNDNVFGFGNLEIDYRFPKNVASRSNVSTREKAKKDVNKFAGVYSMRTVMAKNGNPLHVGEEETKLAENRYKKKLLTKVHNNPTTAVSKRPMLVELHTFPGFNKDELTPLPASLSTKHVLDIVTRAQEDLLKKPSFRKEFKRMFHSSPSQAIVQDIFWWFFIEKYQSCPEVQSQLFSRVACNYVNLIISGSENIHREAFFKRFPSLVSQAVYTVFCRAFPTSYRQFDDRFKQDLADVIFLWIVGTRPIRRVWEKWPLASLEPEGMNKEEEIQKNVSKEFALGLFGSESVQSMNHPSQVGKPERGRRMSRVYGRRSFADELTAVPVSEEQVAKKKSSLRSIHRINESDENVTANNETVTSNKRSSLRMSFSRLEAVQPGEKLVERNETHSDPKLNISNSFQSTNTGDSSLLRNSRKRESCHAGKGPEFQKVVFDLHGQSPLVKHFLQNKRLAKDSGTSILVQRTEIDKLPPINAPTYSDVIKESLKSSHNLERQIQCLLDQMSNERAVFGRQQRKDREEFKKKEMQVLSRQKEVKKISDLILLRLAKEDTPENEKLISASIANMLKLDEELFKS